VLLQALGEFLVMATHPHIAAAAYSTSDLALLLRTPLCLNHPPSAAWLRACEGAALRILGTKAQQQLRRQAQKGLAGGESDEEEGRRAMLASLVGDADVSAHASVYVHAHARVRRCEGGHTCVCVCLCSCVVSECASGWEIRFGHPCRMCVCGKGGESACASLLRNAAYAVYKSYPVRQRLRSNGHSVPPSQCHSAACAPMCSCKR